MLFSIDSIFLQFKGFFLLDVNLNEVNIFLTFPSMYKFVVTICVYFYLSSNVFSQCHQECDDAWICVITEKISNKRFYDLSFNPGDSFIKCKDHFCIGGKKLDIKRDPAAEEDWEGSGDIIHYECSGRIGGRERMMIVTLDNIYSRIEIRLAEERDLALNQTTSSAFFHFTWNDNESLASESSGQSKDKLNLTNELDVKNENKKEDPVRESKINSDNDIDDVPFAVIENVPIYPGCEGSGNNDALKACFSKKIQEFVNQNFNKNLAIKLGLQGRQRISVQFKIDQYGNAVDIRTRAPHPKLEDEAINVIRSLPQVIPGKQRGQKVGVLYALPI